MWRLAAIILLGGLLLAPSIHAQSSQSSPPAPHVPGKRVRALRWIAGPAAVPAFENSTLNVPDGFLALGWAGTMKLEVLTHFAVPDGREIALAPRSLRWFAYLEFSDDGLVKDSDRDLDATALLGALRLAAEQARKKDGFTAVPTGWVEPPTYNSSTRRLEWATSHVTLLGRQVVTFTTKILGRRGVTTVVLQTSPADEAAAAGELREALAGYEFNTGERYSDWQPGDKVAAYGLTGLIVPPPPPALPALSLPSGGALLGILAGGLVGMLILLALIYFAVRLAIRRLFRYLGDTYSTLAKEAEAQSDPGAAAGAARPAASVRKRSTAVRVVQAIQQVRAAFFAGVYKKPVSSLLVAGIVVAAFRGSEAIDLALFALFALYLIARGFSRDDFWDQGAHPRFRSISAYVCSVLLPLVYGLAGVVLLQGIFNLAGDDSAPVRAYGNHLSYLAVESEDWRTFCTPATIALAAGLPLLAVVTPVLRWIKRWPGLTKTLHVVSATVVIVSSFAFLLQAPAKLGEWWESVFPEHHPAESEASRTSALQAIYLIVENLGPRDAWYYRELFTQLNDTEPYGHHGAIIADLLEERLSATDGAETGATADDSAEKPAAPAPQPLTLQQTAIPAALEHPGTEEESVGVIQALFRKQIGAQTPEIRGLADTFIEKLVAAESPDLLRRFQPQIEVRGGEIALEEARAKLKVLAGQAGAASNDDLVRAQIRTQILKAAAEVRTEERKEEQKEEKEDQKREKENKKREEEEDEKEEKGVKSASRQALPGGGEAVLSLASRTEATGGIPPAVRG